MDTTTATVQDRQPLEVVETYWVQNATGPNPDNKPLELMESDGLRVMYCDTVKEAQDWLNANCDGEVRRPPRRKAGAGASQIARDANRYPLAKGEPFLAPFGGAPYPGVDNGADIRRGAGGCFQAGLSARVLKG